MRYDKERKKFISTVEQKHPIYRLLAKIIAGYNFTVRRRLHQKNWMRAFVEQVIAAAVAIAGVGVTLILGKSTDLPLLFRVDHARWHARPRLCLLVHTR